MNINLIKNVMEQLNKKQKNCTARILTEKELFKILEDMEKFAMQIAETTDTKAELVGRFAEGKHMKGYNYNCTFITVYFYKNGKINDVNVTRTTHWRMLHDIQIKIIILFLTWKKRYLRSIYKIKNIGNINI